MGYWYHPELEEPTIGVVMDYHGRNTGARWKIEFPGGETYVCDYFTDYASDNSGDLDVEDVDSDPRYDEFYVVSFLINEIVVDGGHRYRDSLSLTYRDFPTRITNADTGEVIYQAS